MKKIIGYTFVMFLTFSAWSQDNAEKREKLLMDKGFYNRLSIGVLGGSSASFSFNIVNGYQFNQHWSAGVGLGFENFFWSNYAPIFLEGNYHFLKTQTGPWINLLAGYAVPTTQLGSNRGGFTGGAKFGFDFAINDHLGIMTALGYRYAHLNEAAPWNPWDDFFVISDINRFDFRFGLVFRQ